MKLSLLMLSLIASTIINAETVSVTIRTERKIDSYPATAEIKNGKIISKNCTEAPDKDGVVFNLLYSKESESYICSPSRSVISKDEKQEHKLNLKTPTNLAELNDYFKKSNADYISKNKSDIFYLMEESSLPKPSCRIDDQGKVDPDTCSCEGKENRLQYMLGRSYDQYVSFDPSSNSCVLEHQILSYYGKTTCFSEPSKQMESLFSTFTNSIYPKPSAISYGACSIFEFHGELIPHEFVYKLLYLAKHRYEVKIPASGKNQKIIDLKFNIPMQEFLDFKDWIKNIYSQAAPKRMYRAIDKVNDSFAEPSNRNSYRNLEYMLSEFVNFTE